MGKHLSEDTIKTTIEISTAKSVQQLHTLEQATKDLRSEEKARKNKMIELEAAGKKNSEAYGKLSAECKDYSKSIRENEKELSRLRGEMDVNAMTMNQLRKQAKDLRRALDDTSKEANPEKYNSLEKQLNAVKGRMGDLTTTAKSMKDVLTSETTMGFLGGGLIMRATDAVGNLIDKMKDFVGEGIEMAESADGVTHAFGQMNKAGLLDNLRKATKGTVNDFDLMKAAVQAKDFRIPLKDLGTYLQFAQLKAQQTGQSVEYMTESIVLGLGRKSKMILDNLGISAAEIDEKVAKTGDFTKAVAEIVSNQLKNAGQTYVSAADRALQKTTKLQNEQLSMGQALIEVKELWTDAYGNISISIMKVIAYLASHKQMTLLVTTAILGFNLAMSATNLKVKEYIVSSKLAKLATAAWETTMTTFKGVALLFSAAFSFITGNAKKATETMKIFNETCKSNVYVLVATAVLALAAAFVYYVSKSEKALDLSKQMAETYKSLRDIAGQTKQKLAQDMTDIAKATNDTVVSQTTKIKLLTKVINDNNQTNAKRKEALDEIKKIVPGYHAQITAEGKLINNNTSALNNYIKALKKTALEQAIVSKMTDIAKGELNNQLDKTRKQGNKNYVVNQAAGLGINLNKQRVVAVKTKTVESDPDLGARTVLKNVYKVVDKATGKFVKGLDDVGERAKKLQDIYDYRVLGIQQNDAVTKQNNSRNNQLERFAANKGLNLVNTVKETPNSSKAPKVKKNTVDKVGREQKAVYNNDRKKELDEEEASYQRSLTSLSSALVEKKKTQEQYDAEVASLELLHAKKRLDIESEYSEKSKNLKIKDGNDKQRIVNAQQANLDDAKKSYDEKQLAAEKNFYEAMQQLNEASLTDEQRKAKDYKMQLSALEAYYQTSLTYAKENGQSEVEVTAAYEAAKANIIHQHEQQKLQEHQQLMQQYGITNAQTEQQDDLKELDKNKSKMSDDEYQKAKSNVNAKYDERHEQMRQQYGLATDQEIYNQELAALKLHLEQKEITQEEYEKAVSNMKRDSWKKQFDYYQDLFGGAVNALMQAEESNVDAKYDAEIQAAQGNSEKVEQLEKQKANEKLKIQKKYADVNFAMQAAQIVANTATSIMKAYSEMGPIAGSIAAALMGVTGAAQLYAANQERQKVKRMTLQNTGSSSSTSGMRVASGREEGGSIDVRREQDGKLFKAKYDPGKRGYVDHPTVIVGEGPAGQSKEWVASNAAINNPTVAPVLNVIDQYQRAGKLQMLDLNKYLVQSNKGYATGGNIDTAMPTTPTVSSAIGQDNTAAMNEMLKLLRQMNEQGVPAYVALNDIDAKQELRERTRKFAKK